MNPCESLPTTAPDRQKALLRILVTGLDESLLKEYEERNTVPEEEKKKLDGFPYVVDPEDYVKRRRRYLDQYQFGIVGATSALGTWGRTRPLPLYKDRQRSTEGSSAFVGRVTVPLSERDEHFPSLDGTYAELECRLVIMVHRATSDWEESPGLRVVAVENAETFPIRLTAERFKESATYELTLDDSALPAVGELEELGDVTEVWRAEWEVRRPLRFSLLEEQFAFLHTIANFSPSMLKQKYMDYHDMRKEQEIMVAEMRKGPLLSLTFYCSDPRNAFNYEEWLTSQPTTIAQALRTQTALLGYPATSAFEVKRVQPAPMEGNCWCDSHLPVPAPLQKRQEEKRTRKATTKSYASVHKSYTRSCRTGTSTHTNSGEGSEESTAGWCVRPLEGILPVKTFGKDGRVTSQQCWSSVLNVACLHDHGIEVTLEALVPHSRGQATLGKGKTIIAPSMLKTSTKGTLQLPVYCVDQDGKGAWMIVHVQYLVVFPYNHDHSDLRVVRSLESYNRLTVETLVGHRGLGKTYTRMRQKGQTAKLAENSIESFQAAHRRGCAMVEFDVMLTYDRVPIIIHDPIIRLQAKQKPMDGGQINPEEGKVLAQPSNTGEKILAQQDPNMYSRLLRLIAQHRSDYLPVPISVHSLTKTQLDGLITESYDLGGSSPRLKLLILRYWPHILRIYRNRVRLQYIKDNDLTVEGHVGDEFQGCRGDPYDSLTVTVNGNTVNLLPFLDSFRAQEFRNNRFLRSQVDMTNKIPTLKELFEAVPTSLRMDIEVKYPFQPDWDGSLYQQLDAFEVNGFVDSVLDVVFAYAPEGREIAFSSFEPDICIALLLKQSRYDVVFLSDTEEKSDLKDYRSFFVSGAIQFASLHYLAGISIDAGTLCGPEQSHFPSTPIPEEVQHAYGKRLQRIWSCKAETEGDCIRSIPTTEELLAAVRYEHEKRKKISTDPHCDSVVLQFEQRWSQFDPGYGMEVVREAHRRGLKVWTWGSANSNHRFTCVQAGEMKVDGIITDDIPVVEA